MAITSGFTPYEENIALDALFGAGSPSSLYAGLAESVDGNTVAGEPTIGENNYARVPILNNDTNWPAASNGSKKCQATITFNNSTGAWNSGDPLSVLVLYDAASGGHALAWGTLAVPVVVNGANITITLTGNQDLAVSIAPTNS